MSRLVLVVAEDTRKARLAEFLAAGRHAAATLRADLVPVSDGADILRAIEQAEAIDHLTVVGHGSPTWLLRPGRAGVHVARSSHPAVVSLEELAATLGPRLTRNARVALASCLCARSPLWLFEREHGRGASSWGPWAYLDGGTGSLCYRLRDALCAHGAVVTVAGHTTAGHTTYNPCGREFHPIPGQVGRGWFSWCLPLHTRPTAANRRTWTAIMRGAMARELLYWGTLPEIVTEVQRRWGA